MDFQNAAGHLMHNLHQRMSPSLYDAAWLVRLRAVDGAGIPDFRDWLLAEQHPDGSWGAAIRYYHHDRILCTLMALVALAEDPQDSAARSAVQRGEKFFWQNAHLVFRDPAFTELVGFELIFPSLLEEARAVGLKLPAHDFGLGSLRDEKLRLIPPEMILSRGLTTVHSIEFLGRSARAESLDGALFENGSLGNSPAATAYYLWLCGRQGVTPDARAAGYLKRVSDAYIPTIYLYPFRNFEALWVLNNFALIDRDLSLLAALPAGLLDTMEAGVAGPGVGLDDEFGIPDADCTSVACFLLRLAGRPASPAALVKYEVPGEGFFRTYYFERNPSISTNIHALEALRLMPEYPRRELVRERVRNMLLEKRRFNLFWTDKWHASPYYATAYALIALLNGDGRSKDICRDTIDWLIHAQRDNGSWGFFERGTVEETAYALLALQHAHRYGGVGAAVLKRGAAYLEENGKLEDPDATYEPLWLGKCLYAPHNIVRSAILAALLHQERIY